MIAWLSEPEEDPNADEEEGIDDLIDPERAWAVFRFMENTQGDSWQWLPNKGGILDQDYALWHDLMVLRRAKDIVADMMAPGLGGPEMRDDDE